jgi:signal transduction histidine kinase
MSGNAARLYEEDFIRWTEEQAAALRQAAGLATNLPLDWENLAEEIDSLGRSLRHELRSRIAVIIEHLIKLESSPATGPRRGWMETIGRERLEIEVLLDDNPSLKGEIPSLVPVETVRAARYAAQALRRHGEATPDVVTKFGAASYTQDQVLGDWFPGDAPHPIPLPADGERE